jgi:RHS repeat-associated protein
MPLAVRLRWQTQVVHFRRSTLTNRTVTLLSVSGAPTTNSFAYTGREFDATGLYFYRARYYNPILGRFISEDPAREDDNQNFFKYAADNPVIYMDPSGLFVEILCERISQLWLGYWRRAKHCRVHAQCGSLDKTFELEGPRPGSRHGESAGGQL